MEFARTQNHAIDHFRLVDGRAELAASFDVVEIDLVVRFVANFVHGIIGHRGEKFGMLGDNLGTKFENFMFFGLSKISNVDFSMLIFHMGPGVQGVRGVQPPAGVS